MRFAALAAMPAFQTQFEGRVRYVYLDGDRNPTVGIGHLLGMASNLAGAIANAQRLPFLHMGDDTPASLSEIADEVKRIFNAWPVQSTGDAKVATLYLADVAIDALLASDVAAIESPVRQAVPSYDVLFADAQVALVSMGFAMGGAFFQRWGFKSLQQGLNASPPDYGPGVSVQWKGTGNAARIAATQLCFRNARDSQAAGGAPDVLIWPDRVTPPLGAGEET